MLHARSTKKTKVNPLALHAAQSNQPGYIYIYRGMYACMYNTSLYDAHAMGLADELIYTGIIVQIVQGTCLHQVLAHIT